MKYSKYLLYYFLIYYCNSLLLYIVIVYIRKIINHKGQILRIIFKILITVVFSQVVALYNHLLKKYLLSTPCASGPAFIKPIF